ncbi:MAG: hypothetical protein KF872_05985 [Chitinophagales bacterium]|nr:hypothetical protein [Chitinophagales bacterium]
MKTTVIIAATLLLLAACSEQAANMRKMQQVQRQYILDRAFKGDGEIDIQELKSLEVIASNYNYVDTLRASAILTTGSKYMELYKTTSNSRYLDSVQEYYRKARLAVIFPEIDPKPALLYRYFIKASIYEGAGASRKFLRNYMDTCVVPFTTSLERIDID